MEENGNLIWEKTVSSQEILIDLSRSSFCNVTSFCYIKIQLYNIKYLASNKMSEKNKEQVFFKILLNKNAGLKSWNVSKKRLQHRCNPVNIAKFLRTTVLKNICERLFERFAKWASNITSNRGSAEDTFSKTKQKYHSKSQLDEKTCLPMMFLITSPLHVPGGVCHT